MLDEINIATSKILKNPDITAFYGAPTAIVISTAGGSPMSAACVADYMLLAATDLGLGSIFVLSAIAVLNTGANAELVEKLNLPEAFTPTVSIALGIPTEDMKNMP